MLGGGGIAARPVTLPGLDDARAVLVIEKYRSTPRAYPRREGTPEKSPLRSCP